MATLQAIVEAYIVAKNCDAGEQTRLAFWVTAFGTYELTDITPDEVDAAIVRLAERGRLNWKGERLGKSLAGSTINRYIKQLAQIYKHAKRLRLLPRTFVAPTQGIEMEKENAHHDRYFTEQEVEILIQFARLLDTRWGKMEALIVLA